ncbi:MAG: deoxyribonuclease IV [Acidobacteriota bacterium]|nr:deoxyribonuclease IV [Acidobacteriota bacterium]
MPPRIGIHCSTKGGLQNAAIQANRLGANCLQIFSSSPRMWRASVPAPDDIANLTAARRRFDLYPLVVHAGYLINLATLDPVIRQKSIAGFRGELERAVAIGAEYLVIHPGNYKGQSLHQGIAAFALGLAEAARGLNTEAVTVLLQNTVGCGTQIGSHFQELHTIRQLLSRECGVPVGYCLDTCHLLASGFDVATEAGLNKTLEHAENILGLQHVKQVHANDSKGVLASKLDRHHNIGEGKIGIEAFRRILRHPALAEKPFILETPVDEEGDDKRNVEALWKIVKAV